MHLRDGEYNSGAGTLLQLDSVAFINDGQWHHVAVRLVAGVMTLFIDGAEADAVVTFSGTVNTVFSGNASFTVGAFNEGAAQWLNADIFDVRLSPRGWDDSELARVGAMESGATDAGPMDMPLHYKLEEGGGNVGFNSGSLGAAGNLTISSSNLGSLHNTTLNDVYSWQNEEGYTEGDGTNGAAVGEFIPKANNSTLDAAGNELQYTGQAPYDPIIETPCGKFGGTDFASKVVTPVPTSYSVFDVCESPVRRLRYNGAGDCINRQFR